MKVFAHFLAANDLALEIILISSGQNKIADRCPAIQLFYFSRQRFLIP
jgi:hypothetical protein